MRQIPILCAALAATFFAAAATAQQAGIQLSSPEHDRTLPVEVTSDLLDVDDASGRAVFTGNAKAVQGQMVLIGRKIELEYTSDDGTIQQVIATDDVIFTNGIEIAEGDYGIYFVETGMVEMEGNVLLLQGNNTIAGDFLELDLNTNFGTMTGNVRSIYTPQSEDADAESDG